MKVILDRKEVILTYPNVISFSIEYNTLRLNIKDEEVRVVFFSNGDKLSVTE
jgi:hypothetical protein